MIRLLVLRYHSRNKKEDGEQDMEVKKIIVHDGWDSSTTSDDIALLIFKKKAKITETVGTVCVAGRDINPNTNPSCYITGMMFFLRCFTFMPN